MAVPLHRKCHLSGAYFPLNFSRAVSLSECIFLVPQPQIRCSLHPILDRQDPLFQQKGGRGLGTKNSGLADSDCAGNLDFSDSSQWEFKLNYQKWSVEILPSV